jgi:hypothetical protein
MNYSIKDFVRGSLVFVGIMSVLSAFLIVNGLFWGGAF